MHAGRSCDQPWSQDTADVTHPQPLHDRARASVVDLGEGDDVLHAQDRESVVETGASDLGRVTAPPNRPPKRPADLRALGAFDEGPGRPATPEEHAGRLLVSQPLADPVIPPLALLHPLGEAQRLFPAPGVPPGDALVLVELPELLRVPRADRDQAQPFGPLHSACFSFAPRSSQNILFHAPGGTRGREERGCESSPRIIRHAS